MSQVAAIAGREFRSFFRVPMGWVIIALYLLLAGYIFAFGVLTPGSPATLRDFFIVSQIFVLILTPAISMRLISEELRSGTFEALMTSPVTPLCTVHKKLRHKTHWQRFLAEKFFPRGDFFSITLVQSFT